MSEVIDIYGFEYPLPTPPPSEEMLFYHNDVVDQKWSREKIDVESWLIISKEEFQTLPDDEKRSVSRILKKQNEIAVRELDRIRNGVWFYNKGKPTYLTGMHYAYLQHWYLDSGYPSYRDRDRRFFYVWDLVTKDSNCYGMIYMKHRREGATSRATCINYFTAILGKYRVTGIQSKGGEDAKKVFRKIVKSWRKLPPFLRPQTDGTTNPKEAINFTEPGKRITAKNRRYTEHQEVLESEISYRKTYADGFDGYRLALYHGDEFGKCLQMKVTETWNIVKECLVEGNEIVGKAIITSTVAEMEQKGGQEFKTLWEGSDPEDRDLNGRTITGMYRLFIPAYDGLAGFINEYGESDIEGAKNYLMNKRKPLLDKGQLKDLSEEKRKYPMDEREALEADGSNSVFDSFLINEQIHWLEDHPNIDQVISRGNFEWDKKKKNTKVVFKPHPEGRWYVHQLLPQDEANKTIRHGSHHKIDAHGERHQIPKFKPDNGLKFVMGVDPYKHTNTEDRRASNGAVYVYRKFDVLDVEESNVFVAEYLCRPETKQVFYQDIVKAAWYYGSPILYENQISGLFDYCDESGYIDFLMNRPKSTTTKMHAHRRRGVVVKGAPQTSYTKQQICDEIEYYIKNNIEKVVFVRLLKQWLYFEVKNSTKYDATIASGYALIAAKERQYQRNETKDISAFFTTYDYKGQ